MTPCVDASRNRDMSGLSDKIQAQCQSMFLQMDTYRHPDVVRARACACVLSVSPVAARHLSVPPAVRNGRRAADSGELRGRSARRGWSADQHSAAAAAAAAAAAKRINTSHPPHATRYQYANGHRAGGVGSGFGGVVEVQPLLLVFVLLRLEQHVSCTLVQQDNISHVTWFVFKRERNNNFSCPFWKCYVKMNQLYA